MSDPYARGAALLRRSEGILESQATAEFLAGDYRCECGLELRLPNSPARDGVRRGRGVRRHARPQCLARRTRERALPTTSGVIGTRRSPARTARQVLRPARERRA